MRFDIITIFPDIFESYFSESILGRAQKNGLVEIKTSDLRQWTTDNHKTVDDRPYSGRHGDDGGADFQGGGISEKFSIFKKENQNNTFFGQRKENDAERYPALGERL